MEATRHSHRVPLPPPPDNNLAKRKRPSAALGGSDSADIFRWKSPVYCIRVKKKRKALSLRQRACELFTLSNRGGRMREGGKEGKRGVARLQEASELSEAFETSTSRSRLHISREEDGGEVWSGAGEMGESDEGQREKREPKIDERKQSYMEFEAEHVEMTLGRDRLWQKLNDVFLSAKLSVQRAWHRRRRSARPRAKPQQGRHRTSELSPSATTGEAERGQRGAHRSARDTD
ncbi:hypothetical protein EYF80_004937 [Liparis tanakae]|uniref:Uncharacterized protein n=1 Tax=Liparis tanakae TaxID=230148 RepID=A0A4Z2J5W9_9TELE|nr:hypothetical protein EYF80_004937 [Liparis tanakae]